MFKRLPILPSSCVDPLTWWRIHESQFPNMGFLAKQILGILGSQIEIERVFSLASVLTTLRHCHLQMENMDQIIMMVKNWPDDQCHNWKPNVNLKEYFKEEDSFVEENYDLLEEADFFEQLQVDND
jgi:hypothetical protein